MCPYSRVTPVPTEDLRLRVGGGLWKGSNVRGLDSEVGGRGLGVYLLIYLSIYLHLYLYLSICLYLAISIYLCMSIYIYLSTCLHTYLSIYLFMLGVGSRLGSRSVMTGGYVSVQGQS